MYRIEEPSQIELEKFFDKAKKSILDRMDDWIHHRINDVKVPCRSKKLNLTARVSPGSVTDVFLRRYHSEAALKNLMLGKMDDFINVINDLKNESTVRHYPEAYVFFKLTLKLYETFENGGRAITATVTKDFDHFNTIVSDVFLDHGYDGKESDGSPVFEKDKFVRMLNLRICPYCGRSFIYSVQQAGSKTVVKPQIDHFLPKSTYPFFALSFMNLIPSCQTCNMKDCKGDHNPIKVVATDCKYLIPYPYKFDGNKVKIKYVLNGTAYNEDSNFDVKVDYGGDIDLKKGCNEFLKLEEFYKLHNIEVAGMYRQMMILASMAKMYYQKLGVKKPWLKPTPMLLLGFNFNDDNSRKYMLYKFKHDVYIQMMSGEVGKMFK